MGSHRLICGQSRQSAAFAQVNPKREDLTEGEPARVPGSPAKRCAGNSAGFECPAFLDQGDEPARWSGPVWKAGEGETPEFRLLRLPRAMESEPARAAGAAPKADERVSAAVRVCRSPRMDGEMDGEAAGWQPPA